MDIVSEHPGNGTIDAISFPTLYERPWGFEVGNSRCPDLHETAFDAVHITKSFQNSFFRPSFQEQSSAEY